MPDDVRAEFAAIAEFITATAELVSRRSTEDAVS